MDNEHKDFKCYINVDDEFNNVSRLFHAIDIIAYHYGLEKQLDIMVEECSELIKSIMKFKRDDYTPGAMGNVIEEMADVYIVLHQLIKLFAVDDEIINIANRKATRQLVRMEKEKCSKV